MSIMDIWSFSGKNISSLSTLVDPKSAIYRKHFLSWKSLVKSIPSNWINLLKSDENSTKTISMKNNILSCGGMILQNDKLSSNSIYTVLCDNLSVKCKSQLKFSKLTHEFEWHDVCNLISLVAIDSI